VIPDSKWTAREVLDAVEILPAVRDNDSLWAKIWTRRITEFGLNFLMPEPELPYDKWDEEMWAKMELIKVPTEWIRYSAQPTVRLDVLEWYLKMPVWKVNFDTDGWYGNEHPVLIMLPDGKYVIKDGNHRIISRMISNFEFVEGYVMRGYYPGTRDANARMRQILWNGG
jgi:hypothetical protein